MCWSTQASLVFSLFDVAATNALFRRNKGSDRIFATILLPIAVQEIFQLILWTMGAPTAKSCSIPNRIFSFMAPFSAQILPISLFLTKSSSQDNIIWMVRAVRILAWILYVGQLFLHLIAIHISKTYCVHLGPNHHQIWISDEADFKVGGVGYYHTSMLLYLISMVLAVITTTELPDSEKMSLVGVGFGTYLVAFIIYPATLEAGSIWCWSACLVGVYALTRPLPPKEKDKI